MNLTSLHSWGKNAISLAGGPVSALAAAIPVSWYIIFGLALTNGFTLYMWRSAAHDLEIIEVRSEEAARNAERVLAEQKQITEDTKNGWEAALGVTRDYWADRMRRAHVQPMPGISGSPAGAVGAADDPLPPPDRVAADCAAETVKLLFLQRWVTQQRQAK